MRPACCAEEIPETLPASPQVKTVHVAAAAIVDVDGRVLIAQRPEGKKMAGLWEFPGGKIEQGETPEYALQRELWEELGIRTAPSCFSPVAFASHTYSEEGFHLMMPVFACRQWEGEISMNEHQNLKWVKPVDMYAYPMPEADKPLIPMLIQNI